jgi:hypothetical protein
MLKVVRRLAIEERDGALYAAGVRIDAEEEQVAFEAGAASRRKRSSGVPICERTLWRLDDALLAEAKAAGSNMRVVIDGRMRLKHCARCNAPFLAHPAAKLCSPDCRVAIKIVCRRCGQPVANPSRSTRAFCSNACRQANHRAKKTAPGGIVSPRAKEHHAATIAYPRLR